MKDSNHEPGAQHLFEQGGPNVNGSARIGGVGEEQMKGELSMTKLLLYITNLIPHNPTR